MTESEGPRFTPQQIRGLAVVWIGITVLVAVCTFLGIWWALSRSNDAASESRSGGAASPPAPAVQATPLEATPMAAEEGGGDAEAPAAAPTPTIPPLQDPSFGYGIQAQLHMDTRNTLDMIEQLGMNWTKQQVRWADLEPAQGAANWDALDKIFSRIAERPVGPRVMISIVDAPDWSRSVTAEGKAGPPDDPQTFVNYVTQMVQRYSGQLHAIEIWNEQNLDREWYTAGGLSAQGYVQLLAATEQAVHAIDPNIIIISGALSPTGWDDGVSAIDDFRYMQMMIDAGLLDYADCVGAHHNGINLPPNQSAEDAYSSGMPAGTVFSGPYDTGNPLNPHHSWSFYSTLNGYHDMIVAAGRDTPLCVTEFGWASMEGLPAGEPRAGFEFAWDNSLEEQATYVTQAFTLMHDWGFVWLAFLWNLDFSPKAGGDPSNDNVAYSILTPEGLPRPAFDALRDMPKPP